MDKNLLLFDVDGTLISYDGIVPSSTIEALKKSQATRTLCLCCNWQNKE